MQRVCRINEIVFPLHSLHFLLSYCYVCIRIKKQSAKDELFLIYLIFQTFIYLVVFTVELRILESRHKTAFCRKRNHYAIRCNCLVFRRHAIHITLMIILLMSLSTRCKTHIVSSHVMHHLNHKLLPVKSFLVDIFVVHYFPLKPIDATWLQQAWLDTRRFRSGRKYSLISASHNVCSYTCR